MKASLFNTITDLGEDEKLIFNSYSNCLAKADRSTLDIYRRLTSQDEKDGLDLSDPYISAAIADFKRGGFMLDDDFNEKNNFKLVDIKKRFSDYKNFALTIAPTMDCNFKCPYCYESNSEVHGIMTREVEDKIIDYVERKLQTNGAFMVRWFGGEPLLALDTICRLSDAFIKMTEKKKSKYYSSILTNGYLLDKKTVEILKKYKVDGAQVTLDGPPEYHDRTRCLKNGKGTFDKIVENIKQIGNDFAINVVTNIGKENAELFPALLDILEEKEIIHKIVLNIGQIQPHEYLSQQVNDAAFTSEEFSKAYTKLVGMLVDRKVGTSIVAKSWETHCGANSYMGMLVGHDGSLYKCWDAICNPSECVGHIGQDIFICDGMYKWLAWDAFKNEECCNCNVLPLCMGGCVRKVLVKDSILNQQDHCSHYKYNLPELLKILYKQQLDVKKAR